MLRHYPTREQTRRQARKLADQFGGNHAKRMAAFRYFFKELWSDAKKRGLTRPQYR